MSARSKRLRAPGWIFVTALLSTVLISCGGQQQSAVDPRGPQAGRVDTLWWFFFWLLGAVFIVTLGFTLWTLIRRNKGAEQEQLEAHHRPAEETEFKLRQVVVGSSVMTIIILFVLIVSSVRAGKALLELSTRANPLTIEITGNQWWWQIRYINTDPSQILVTANEIHIPVGRPIQIRGLSNDVIHSFWIPNLNGKRDLIPSHVTTQWMEADRPGIYRGQCAEFCGAQHAHMAIWVIAEPEAQFESWMRAQIQPANPPGDPVRQKGQQVFMNSSCVFCHQIRGTNAAGQNGPDLTHFGSRRGIAANAVPNTKGYLAGWILDPQSTKPGNHMATTALHQSDLNPLLEYLESLK